MVEGVDGATAFYEDRGGGVFAATALTRGPWNPEDQHAGPTAGLVGRCLEGAHGSPDAHIARVTVEILGPIPIDELEVETALLRPGRSVALLGAVVRCRGREVVRASAWRIRQADIGLEVPPEAPRHPGPAGLAVGPFIAGAPEVGYHTAMEIRPVVGGFDVPGPGIVWFRMRVPLVAGEEPSPLVRVLVAADCGNGVSGVEDPRALLYVNTDLTVSLHRSARGEWVLLDARTVIDRQGIGQASSVLHDGDGAIGSGLQTLFVARR